MFWPLRHRGCAQTSAAIIYHVESPKRCSRGGKPAALERETVLLLSLCALSLNLPAAVFDFLVAALLLIGIAASFAMIWTTQLLRREAYVFAANHQFFAA
jgi:hypothetical protein